MVKKFFIAIFKILVFVAVVFVKTALSMDTGPRDLEATKKHAREKAYRRYMASGFDPAFTPMGPGPMSSDEKKL